MEREFAVRFKAMTEAGTVAANYVNILWMLLRLRQACNHPALACLPPPSQSPYSLSPGSGENGISAEGWEVTLLKARPNSERGKWRRGFF